jgi:hypothetical protein
MSTETANENAGILKTTTKGKENVEPKDDDELSTAEKNAADRFYNDLEPLKEDLAEWLSRVLEEDIKAETLLDSLDNGILVCKLAQIVQKAAEIWIKSGKKGPTLPLFTMKYHKNAKSQTFFARDNTAHFLKWCKEIGVQDSVMFESDGLVLHKQPREVALCLLDVARIAASVGIEPPHLIKLEKEIDQEIAEDDKKVTVKPKGRKTSKALNVDSEVSDTFMFTEISE